MSIKSGISATSANEISIGNGLPDSYKGIVANIGDGINYAISYDPMDSKWVFTNNGITWNNLGSGTGGGFTAGGDLAGTDVNQTVIGIRGYDVQAVIPDDGYALVFDNTGGPPGVWQPRQIVPDVKYAYVSDSGGDNATAKLGSRLFPFKTIMGALNAIQTLNVLIPGDGYYYNVEIDGGQYIENIVIPPVPFLSLSGTSGYQTILTTPGSGNLIELISTTPGGNLYLYINNLMLIVPDGYCMYFEAQENYMFYWGCVIKDVICLGNSAFVAAGSTTIDNCNLDDYTYLLNCSNTNLKNCTINNIFADFGNYSAQYSIKNNNSLIAKNTTVEDLTHFSGALEIEFDKTCSIKYLECNLVESPTDSCYIKYHGYIGHEANVQLDYLNTSIGANDFSYATFNNKLEISAANGADAYVLARNAIFKDIAQGTIYVRRNVYFDMLNSFYAQQQLHVEISGGVPLAYIDRDCHYFENEASGGTTWVLEYEDYNSDPLPFPPQNFRASVIVEFSNIADAPCRVYNKDNTGLDIETTGNAGTLDVTVWRIR